MICDEQSPSASARLRPGHGVEGTRARGRWGRLSSRIKRCRVVGGERGRMTFQRREPAAVTLPGDPGSHPKPRGYQAPPTRWGEKVISPPWSSPQAPTFSLIMKQPPDRRTLWFILQNPCQHFCKLSVLPGHSHLSSSETREDREVVLDPRRPRTRDSYRQCGISHGTLGRKHW